MLSGGRRLRRFLGFPVLARNLRLGSELRGPTDSRSDLQEPPCLDPPRGD